MFLRIFLGLSSTLAMSGMLMAMQITTYPTHSVYLARQAQCAALSHALPRTQLAINLSKIFKQDISDKLIALANQRKATTDVDVAKRILLLAHNTPFSLTKTNRDAELLSSQTSIFQQVSANSNLEIPTLETPEQTELFLECLENQADLTHNDSKVIAERLHEYTLPDLCAIAKTYNSLDMHTIQTNSALLEPLIQALAHKLINTNIQEQMQYQELTTTLSPTIQSMLVRETLKQSGLYTMLHSNNNSNRTMISCAVHERPNQSTSALSWTPAGYHLAYNKKDISVQANDTLYIWDSITQQHIYRANKQQDIIKSLEWSSNGTYLAVKWDHSGEIGIWDTIHKEYRTFLKKEDYTGFILLDIHWLPNSNYIIGNFDDGFVRVWDIENSRCIREIQVAENKQTSLSSVISCSPNGKYIAHIYDKGTNSRSHKTIKILYSNTLATKTEFQLELKWKDNFNKLAWSPDATRIAYRSGSTVKILDITTQQCITLPGLPEKDIEMVWSISWSPDGKCIAIGHDYTINIWNTDTNTYTGTIFQRKVSDNTLVTTYRPNDQLEYMHDLLNRTTEKTTCPVYYISWSPDGKYIGASYGNEVAGRPQGIQGTYVWQWLDPAFDTLLEEKLTLNSILPVIHKLNIHELSNTQALGILHTQLGQCTNTVNTPKLNTTQASTQLSKSFIYTALGKIGTILRRFYTK